MATERDRKIQARAYELWLEGGQRDDSSHADWLRAEAEFGAGSESPDTETAPKPSVDAPREAAPVEQTPPKAAKAPRAPGRSKPAETAGSSASGKPAEPAGSSASSKSAEAAGSPPSSMPKAAPKTGGAKIEGATKVATKRSSKSAGE